MILECTNGTKHESQIDHPKGSIEYPMTPEEMNRNVHLLADPVLGEQRVGALLKLVDGIDQAASITELMDVGRPAE